MKGWLHKIGQQTRLEKERLEEVDTSNQPKDHPPRSNPRIRKYLASKVRKGNFLQERLQKRKSKRKHH